MELICIVCPNSCKLIYENGEIKGAKCPRGVKFGMDEMTAPKRTVCTTVKTAFKDMPVLPVRTDGDIPKDKIFDLMKLVREVVVDKRVGRGEIILKNVLDSGVDLISTSNMKYNK